MGAVTFKNYEIGKAPSRIDLFGDKAKKVESASHVITFPGGAIEISRLDDGSYWAHIIVTQFGAYEAAGDNLHSAFGEIVDTRLDRSTGQIERIEGAERLQQVAVLIRPLKPDRQKRPALAPSQDEEAQP